jgi:hypothetical protein
MDDTIAFREITPAPEPTEDPAYFRIKRLEYTLLQVMRMCQEGADHQEVKMRAEHGLDGTFWRAPR